MDNKFQAFIALFYAIDRLYDERPSDTLGLCAGGLNPFLWDAIGSADPAHFIEFGQEFDTRFPDGVATEADAFAFAREYADKLSATFHAMFPSDETIAALFDKHIDGETWGKLWESAGKAAARRMDKLGNK